MQLQKRELRVNLDSGRPVVALRLVPDQLPLKIGNLSRSGLYAEGETKTTLAPGSRVNFSLLLGDDQDDITGIATIRWVKPADKPGEIQGVGLQVLEFNDQNDKRYLEFLEDCLAGLRINDLMDDSFQVVRPDTDMRDATKAVLRSKYGCAVVTDSDGVPLGLLSCEDIARAASNKLFLDDPVGRHMLPTSTILTTDHSPAEAYDFMRDGNQSFIPVTEDSITVGLLVMKNLLPYWAEYTDLQTKRLIRNYDKAISVIAHDLRTPIGLVYTTNAMLTSGEITAAEYVESGFPETLEHSCELMMNMIDEILDVQKIKVGYVKLSYRTIDLVEHMRQITKAFQPSAQNKKVVVKFGVTGTIPPIKADPVRLSQILNNLISNAIKYSPEQGVIVIGIKPLHSKIAIWVTDQGPGIPSQELNRLFRDFTPLSPKPTRGEKSTGLGLAITKRLIEAHGGTIEVESHQGLGTTFTVTLPIGELQ